MGGAKRGGNEGERSHAPICGLPLLLSPIRVPRKKQKIGINFLYNHNSHCFQSTHTVQSGTRNCAFSRHQIRFYAIEVSMMLVYKLSFKASSWPSCCVPRPFTTADDRHESTRFYAGASDVVSADKTCRHSRNCWRTAMNNYFT